MVKQRDGNKPSWTQEKRISLGLADTYTWCFLKWILIPNDMMGTNLPILYSVKPQSYPKVKPAMGTSTKVPTFVGKHTLSQSLKKTYHT